MINMMTLLKNSFAAKIDGSLKSMEFSRNSLFLEMDMSVDKANEVFASEKYNVPNPDTASATC